jgi:hypothetical protein
VAELQPDLRNKLVLLLQALLAETAGVQQHQTESAERNWNPVPFGDIDIEYLWGHRVLSNLKRDVSGLISRFRMSF